MLHPSDNTPSYFIVAQINKVTSLIILHAIPLILQHEVPQGREV